MMRNIWMRFSLLLALPFLLGAGSRNTAQDIQTAVSTNLGQSEIVLQSGAPDTDTRNSPSASPHLGEGTAPARDGQAPFTAIEAPPPTAAGTSATYAIDWYSINGGGTVNATSTNYQMGASVGQAVAGSATSTNYQMGIGFWYGAASGSGCSCPNLNDPDPNGVPDIVDVGLVINRAFRGAAALLDPGCPQERADVDGSGASDIVDVGLYINVAFRGANKIATFDDDGCTPGNQ